MKTKLKLFGITILTGLLFAGLAFAGPSNTIATVSTSTTAARTANLGAGLNIIVQCTSATRLKFGDSTVTATTSSMQIDALEKWPDKTVPGATYISFILDSGTGTCRVYYDAIK